MTSRMGTGMSLAFFYSVFAGTGVGLAIAGGKVAGAAARLLTNGGTEYTDLLYLDL